MRSQGNLSLKTNVWSDFWTEFPMQILRFSSSCSIAIVFPVLSSRHLSSSSTISTATSAWNSHLEIRNYRRALVWQNFLASCYARVKLRTFLASVQRISSNVRYMDAHLMVQTRVTLTLSRWLKFRPRSQVHVMFSQLLTMQSMFSTLTGRSEQWERKTSTSLTALVTHTLWPFT